MFVWFRYKSYNDTVRWLQALSALNEAMTMESIGKSIEGREIWSVSDES